MKMKTWETICLEAKHRALRAQRRYAQANTLLGRIERFFTGRDAEEHFRTELSRALLLCDLPAFRRHRPRWMPCCYRTVPRSAEQEVLAPVHIPINLSTINECLDLYDATPFHEDHSTYRTIRLEISRALGVGFQAE